MPIPKHAFLAALDCATKGWRALRESTAPSGPGLEWRFHEGQHVQGLARAWLGAGTMLPGGRTQMALDATAAAMADPANTVLFEASFEADGCVARGDALRRLGDGWELLEIKSGSTTRGKPIKPEYLDDVAYTAAVMIAAGVTPKRVSLVLVNAEYVEGAGDELITSVDVTTDALARAAELVDSLGDIAATLEGDPPAAVRCYPCRHCDYYGTSCMDIGISDPLFDLPGLRVKRWEKLIPHGPRIADLPPDADLTDNMTTYVQVVRSGQPMIDAAVLSRLDAMTHPIHYLDFEAIAPAVPRFAGTSPYQKHPFQYSLHTRMADGALVHVEYLADHAGDWRRPLTEHLLHELGDTGRIVVYSNYEEQVLRQLAAWFPDLAPRIEAVIARLFDLEKVVKDGYIHPGFRGRTSIKKVLPVMSPDLSYDGLAVSGGEDASAVFAFMWVGEYPEEEHAQHRAALLEYCKLDTLAMIRVHEGLEAVRRGA